VVLFGVWCPQLEEMLKVQLWPGLEKLDAHYDLEALDPFQAYSSFDRLKTHLKKQRPEDQLEVFSFFPH
jgi:hypothetical protein